MEDDYRCCIIIPCYNHSEAFKRFLPDLLVHGLPIIVVDDGSDAENAATLEQLAAETTLPTLLRMPKNSGKGAALFHGMEEALRLGYTHALQCDADGQHDASAIPRFIGLSRQTPEAIIVGSPQYDESVPTARLYGRRITNFFLKLETRGLCRCDGMCGFRVYPLAASLKLKDKHGMSMRMGMDIQILAEACWAGIPLREAPVRVTYAEGGSSHFHMVRDNVFISALHTKLCTLALLGVGWRQRKAGK